MRVDLNSSSALDIYKVMSGNIIPRPIAWIVTQDEQGILNVAPFSYFTPLSSNPPSVIVSIGHKKDGTPKDTLKNLREQKKCTICMVSESNYKKMHFSSKAVASDVDESELFDIDMEKIFDDFPPMVKGSPAVFCGELLQEVDLKDSPTRPMIIQLHQAFIDEKSGEPICRVGKTYAKIGQALEVPKIP